MVKRGPHNSAITWEPHCQIQFGGTMGVANKEVWTCGLRWVLVNPAAEPTQAQLTAALDPLIADIGAWFTAGLPNSSFIAHDAQLVYVKFNMIESTGLQRAGDTVQAQVAGPANGPTGQQVPWFQTYALTLRTGLTRGRAHSGRIFPPLVCMQPEAGSPYASDSNVAGYISAAANMITNINTHVEALPGLLGHIGIMSPGNTAKGTTPTHQLVTHVTADRVADVQHRRTDRVPRLESETVVIP